MVHKLSSAGDPTWTEKGSCDVHQLKCAMGRGSCLSYFWPLSLSTHVRIYDNGLRRPSCMYIWHLIPFIPPVFSIPQPQVTQHNLKLEA